jgi:hypothetical protein
MTTSWRQQAIREQQRFEAWMDRQEARYTNKIARSKNRTIIAAAKQYEDRPSIDWAVLQRKHFEEMLAIITEIYERVIPLRGRQTISQIVNRKRFGDEADDFRTLIQKWIAEHALERSTLAADTTVNDIRRAIAKGAEDGLGSREIARSIRKVRGLTPSRSETIARTEIHGAASYAQEETGRIAQVDLGLTLKKFWIPALDERVRDAHRAMANSGGVLMDDDFIVNGVPMSRPGDPRGGASNVIRCRCTMVLREVEED